MRGDSKRWRIEHLFAASKTWGRHLADPRLILAQRLSMLIAITTVSTALIFRTAAHLMRPIVHPERSTDTAHSHASGSALLKSGDGCTPVPKLFPSFEISSSEDSFEREPCRVALAAPQFTVSLRVRIDPPSQCNWR